MLVLTVKVGHCVYIDVPGREARIEVHLLWSQGEKVLEFRSEPNDIEVVELGDMTCQVFCPEYKKGITVAFVKERDNDVGIGFHADRSVKFERDNIKSTRSKFEP